jgi:hypothetical protein
MRVRTGLLTVMVAVITGAAACGGGPQVASPTAVSPDLSPPDAQGRCDASRVTWAIGQEPTDELLQRARTAAGAEVARFLRHDQPVTREFLAGRLNLTLNERGVVGAVSCG